MRHQLSSRLSPQAKRAVLQAPLEKVTGIMELDSGVSQQVKKAIESFGGKVRSTVVPSSSLTFEINAKHLADLANVEGVVYVSTQEPYQV